MEMSELANQRDLAADALALLTQVSANGQGAVSAKNDSDFVFGIECFLDPIENITKHTAELFDILDGSVRYIMQVGIQ